MKIKVTDVMLADAVASNKSFRGVLSTLGLRQAGGSQSHYTRRAKALGLDMAHFTGQVHNKGKVSPSRRTPEEVLVLRTEGGRAKSHQLVRSLLVIGRKHECSECGQGPEWRGHPLTLDVDHINEDWLDDREENLRFLCPNCHSQFSRKLIGNMAK